MVEAQQTIADGWADIEFVCKRSEEGDWPQLMRVLEHMTSSSGLKPVIKKEVKKEPGQEGEEVEGVGDEDVIMWKPVKLMVEGKKQYRCPDKECVGYTETVGLYYRMESHIRQWHTKQEYKCANCKFTTYNYDSLVNHERKHHKR